MQRKITSSFLAKIGGKNIEDTVSESGERKKDKHKKEKPARKHHYLSNCAKV